MNIDKKRGKKMEKVTVWTNDFYFVKDEVDRLLAEGKAVRVGADCIGHTRAAMVEGSAMAHFKKVGVVEVESDGWRKWYAIPK